MSRDCCVAIPLSAMSLSAVCDCVTHLLFLGVIHANSDGFGESAHLLGLVWAFVTVQNSHVVTEWHFMRAAKDLASLHVRLTLAFVTVQSLLCCLKWRFVCYSRQQRILWWVCTFAQTKALDNVINIKISCAGSKGSWESARLHRLAWSLFTVSKYHVLVEMTIFVTFMWTANDVVSLHQQPQDFCATISALYQCFKKCSQCVVIKFLNKTFASLPRKTIQSSNRFLDIISLEYDNSCA